jgi:hypothetical protein
MDRTGYRSTTPDPHAYDKWDQATREEEDLLCGIGTIAREEKEEKGRKEEEG